MFSILPKLLFWFLSVLESLIFSSQCVASYPLVLGEFHLKNFVNITFNDTTVGEIKPRSKLKKLISPTIKQKIPLILVPNESSCSLVSKNGPGCCFCANID